MTNLNVDLDELMERAVSIAFQAGFLAAGRTVGRYADCADAYRDWRAYGPGVALPGGERAAETIREHDEHMARLAALPAPTQEQIYKTLKKSVDDAYTGREAR